MSGWKTLLKGPEINSIYWILSIFSNALSDYGFRSSFSKYR
jgi:hypothetical protein